MRLPLFALIAFALPFSSYAAEIYTFDKSHTAITWTVSHMGYSNPSGKWMDVNGKVTIDEQKPANSSIDATINVASIDSGVPKLDEHLKKADFFDTDKFPTAHFVSTKVTPTGDKTAKVEGTLTLHGVTKPITLDVTLNKIGMHPMLKKQAAGFSADTTIKRSDFGISYGVPMVSDEVKIHIETELNLAAG